MLLGATTRKAERPVLRVAVIDRFDSENLSTHKYKTYYERGLALGLSETPSSQTEVRFFQFGKRDLDIRRAAKEALEWKAEVVIGPRFSNLFLLLEGLFPKETLVVSPLASATNVYSMPKNFYTFSPSNRDYAMALATFTKEMKLNRISTVVESDCLYCVNFYNEFKSSARIAGLAVHSEDSYLSSNVPNISYSELGNPLVDSDAILLPNRSWSSGFIMQGLSRQLKKNIIFLGGDGWGDWSVGYVGKFPSQYEYKGYYLVAFALESDSKAFAPFKSKYRQRYSEKPNSSVSLITYHVGRAIAQVASHAKAKTVSLPEALQELLFARPELFRPQDFSVYEISQNGERFVRTLRLKDYQN